MTGDPVYAACCKHTVENYTGDARRMVTEFSNWSAIRNGYVSVLKATAARAMDGDPKGMAEGEKRFMAAIKPPKTERVRGELTEKSLGIPEGYDA